MIRATTPTHSFKFKGNDNPSTFYSVILITYAQCGKILLEKSKSDLTFTGPTTERGLTYYTGSYQLTQKETKLFNPCADVEIQVRVKTSAAGRVMASPIMKMNVQQVLNDEVL